MLPSIDRLEPEARRFPLVRPAVAVLGLALVTLWLAGSVHTQVPGSDSAILAAESSISADRLREADKTISDDRFEGRYPGLRGGQMAADYIAGEFAKLGLKPAGDHGTFLQQVNFVGITAKPAETSFTLHPRPFPAVLQARLRPCR